MITTIHQPSSRMFYMFDKLLLISEGYPIYCGRARESIEYFASLRFVPELAMNPAEFLLDLAAGHMNNISIPDDLVFGQEAKNQEKNSIKVKVKPQSSDLFPPLQFFFYLAFGVVLHSIYMPSTKR